MYSLGLMFLMSEQYFVVKAKDLGMKIEDIVLLVIASTLTQTIFSYYSGLLIDKVGERFMLFISYVFGSVSLIFLFLQYLFLSFVFLGLFSVISLNAIRAYISNNAKSVGFVYGVFYAGIAFFAATGAIIISQLWKYYGFENSMLFSIIGTLFVTLLYSIIKHEN